MASRGKNILDESSAKEHDSTKGKTAYVPLAGVCLLELLRFYAEEYVRIAKTLQELEVMLSFEETEEGYSSTPNVESESGKDTRKRGRAKLSFAIESFEKIGLEVCCVHARELLNSYKLTSGDVRALHENVDRELSCRFFVGIAENRKNYFCESLKGWEQIVTKFPEATDDIEEMNKCFALCRYPASVFHSLLVVEHGLVALGKALGVTDPKQGWDASSRRLKEVVDAGHKANITGLDFTFLEQLNGCVQVMKFSWRNKINHATGKPAVMSGGFSPYVAEEIIAATRSFMRRLIEGLP